MRQKNGECAYCEERTKVTKDHVIPECLFDDDAEKPPNLITVKACARCNNVLKSGYDDDLRDILTTDIYGSRSPIAQKKLAGKVARSVQAGRADMIEMLLTQGRVEPLMSLGGIYLGECVTCDLDEGRMSTILSTLVRGLYYHTDKRRIDSRYRFEIFRHYAWDFRDILQEFARWNATGNSTIRTRELGDVFGYVGSANPHDPSETMWLLWFYRRVFYSVTTINPIQLSKK